MLHKTAYLSESGGLGTTKSGEWAKSRTRIRQKEREDQAEEQERIGDREKWDPTDSPEIPDRGETA